MDVKKILNIGIGRCGNKLVDELITKDKRYSGMMINTAIGDMQELENYKNNRVSSFLIPNADGSGRDRQVASAFVKTNVQRFADEMAKCLQYDLFVLYTSLDGGTGSGTTPMFVKAMRRILPQDKKIMVVGVLPSIPSSKLSYENTIGCWNDLMELSQKNQINSFKFIKNSSRETIEEVNRDAINDLDTAFKLHSFDTEGTIDQKDSFRINTGKEYGIILNLNNSIDDVKLAIEDAKKKSVFAMPYTNDCDYLGILLQKGRYSVNSAIEEFDVYETHYAGHSNGRNVIVASGMAIPVEEIEKINEELKIAKSKKRKRMVDTRFFIKEEDIIVDEVSVESSDNCIKKITGITSDELNKLFDDEFWN